MPNNFVFEILICYVANNWAKSAHFYCRTDVTLKATKVKTSKNHQAYSTIGFCWVLSVGRLLGPSHFAFSAGSFEITALAQLPG